MQNIVEILYGGAVRGGKSWALLAAALMYVDVHNYSAIIFRQNTTDLELTDGLMDIAERWDLKGKGAHYHGGKLRYTFPSGATFSFGYMGPPGKKGHLRYKSAWYQFIGFDQVEEIPWVTYNYMNSRLGRLEGQNVPLRLWNTANPDGYEWVYEHFVKSETRDPSTKFIPATADDNPWVDMPALEERLGRLDPLTFQQLRMGIWGLSTAGGMFDQTKFKHERVLPVGEPLIGVRYWDLAATGDMEGGKPAYSCGLRMFRSLETNKVYVDSCIRERYTPLQVELELKATAMLDRKMVDDLLVRYVDTVVEQEPGASGKSIIAHYLRGPLAGYAASGDRPTGSKEDRARPWASCVAAGNAHLVIGEGVGSARWIEPFKQEHRRFPGGEFKDQVDSSSGAYNKLFDIGRAPKFG